MKKNIILITILILGLFVSSLTMIERIFMESNNKVVDIILDYKEMQDLAEQSGKDLQWWFEKFKDLGVHYVALKEESFESLLMEKKPLKVVMGNHIFKELNWRETYPAQLIDYIDTNGIYDHDVVVVTNSRELFEFISNRMETYYDLEKFHIIEDDEEFAVILHGTLQDTLYTQEMKVEDSNGKLQLVPSEIHSSKLYKLALGLDPKKIEIIENSGLKVLPRPSSYKGWTEEKAVQAVLKNYEELHLKPYVFIFDGVEVLGYQRTGKILQEYMRDNNIKVGLIETPVQRGHITQEGIHQLTRELNYNGIRVFSILPYYQERFQYYHYEGAEEIENTLYRAVTERNIRLIYFRPFKHDKATYVTDYIEYEKMFNRFKNRIASHGMILGQGSVMPPMGIGFIRFTMMGWGIAAAVVLLLDILLGLRGRMKSFILIFGMLGVIGVKMLFPSIADKLLALTGAIVFPSLSMAYFCHVCKKYINVPERKENMLKWIGIPIKDLIICCLISLIGAIFSASTLSHIEYFLEMDLFRGVKLSQLMPILVYGILYMGYFGYNNVSEKQNSTLEFRDIKNFLYDDVKMIYVILSGILLAIGFIYISRTGHETAIQPTELEMMFRNILEEKFLARPRTKEFIIAFPMLMVGIFAAMKRYKWFILPCGLLAVIGQASIVNTFCHLRTPIYISLIRTVNSLMLGIVVGIIEICILEGNIRFWKYLMNKNTIIQFLKR